MGNTLNLTFSYKFSSIKKGDLIFRETLEDQVHQDQLGHRDRAFKDQK